MRSTVVAAVLVLISTVSQSADLPPSYQQNYVKWKNELTSDLKQKWLTLVGLSWLREGSNHVGGDHKLDVPLPEDKVAPHIGVIEFHYNKAVFKADAAAGVTHDGKRVSIIELKPDTSGNPTILQIGDIRMMLIQREQKFGIRVRDMNSKALQGFKGLEFYPVSANYVVTAKFIPYAKAKQVAIPTVLGQDAVMENPGYVEFTINGNKQSLQALQESPDELFFILKDQTAGKGTYPAGRFLYTELPRDGKVVLDFNKAENPPCAWTPYATCPLPPKENYMTVKVEAGEKYLGHH